MSQVIPPEYTRNPLPEYLQAQDTEVLASIDKALASETRAGREEAFRQIAELLMDKLVKEQASERRGESPLNAAKSAHAVFFEAAKRGSAYGASMLADSYADGDAGVVDEQAAAFWNTHVIDALEAGAVFDEFELAQRSGLPSAEGVLQHCRQALARLYCDGSQLERDYTRALALYRQAAQAGEVKAQWNAFMLLRDTGAADDVDEALDWLAKAAKGGDRDADELYQSYQQARSDSKTHERLWILFTFSETPWAKKELLEILTDPQHPLHSDDIANLAMAYVTRDYGAEQIERLVQGLPQHHQAYLEWLDAHHGQTTGEGD